MVCFCYWRTHLPLNISMFFVVMSVRAHAVSFCNTSNWRFAIDDHNNWRLCVINVALPFNWSSTANAACTLAKLHSYIRTYIQTYLQTNLHAYVHSLTRYSCSQHCNAMSARSRFHILAYSLSLYTTKKWHVHLFTLQCLLVSARHLLCRV